MKDFRSHLSVAILLYLVWNPVLMSEQSQCSFQKQRIQTVIPQASWTPLICQDTVRNRKVFATFVWFINVSASKRYESSADQVRFLFLFPWYVHHTRHKWEFCLILALMMHPCDEMRADSRPRCVTAALNSVVPIGSALFLMLMSTQNTACTLL